MSEQSLQDILRAEKEAADRLRKAEEEAARLRKGASEKVSQMEADAAKQIQESRRRAEETLKTDIDAARRKAAEDGQAAIARWEKRYGGKGGDIVAALRRIVLGERDA